MQFLKEKINKTFCLFDSENASGFWVSTQNNIDRDFIDLFLGFYLFLNWFI